MSGFIAEGPPVGLGLVAVEPERANREGDQALPQPGHQDVFEHVIGLLRARQAIGIRRYGRSLETFNGRDAGRDLVEELLDAVVYADQAKLERAALERSLHDTQAALTRAQDELAAARHNHRSAMEQLDAEQRANRQLVDEREGVVPLHQDEG